MSVEKIIKEISKKYEEAIEQMYNYRMEGKHRDAEFKYEYAQGLKDALKICAGIK